MFTGIITAMGTLIDARERNGGRDIDVETPWRDIVVGESIAVDGACLTVVSVDAAAFTAHVVTTSLDRTCFAEYAVGRRLNLERALRVGDRLGGHLVQGHVDGVGAIVAVEQSADARLIDIGVPATVAELAIPLGSIAINGVALTVNALPARDVVQVSLIPFTLDHTNLGDCSVGDRVHVEGDVFGKFVRQMASPWQGVR